VLGATGSGERTLEHVEDVDDLAQWLAPRRVAGSWNHDGAFDACDQYRLADDRRQRDAAPAGGRAAGEVVGASLVGAVGVRLVRGRPRVLDGEPVVAAGGVAEGEVVRGDELR
jgi:hypothetical protein